MRSLSCGQSRFLAARTVARTTASGSLYVGMKMSTVGQSFGSPGMGVGSRFSGQALCTKPRICTPKV